VRCLTSRFICCIVPQFRAFPPPRTREGGGNGGLVGVWMGQLGSEYTGVLRDKIAELCVLV
jgi:hypothetical protein